jgi:hypothetical protein
LKNGTIIASVSDIESKSKKRDEKDSGRSNLRHGRWSVGIGVERSVLNIRETVVGPEQ